MDKFGQISEKNSVKINSSGSGYGESYDDDEQLDSDSVENFDKKDDNNIYKDMIKTRFVRSDLFHLIFVTCSVGQDRDPWIGIDDT